MSRADILAIIISICFVGCLIVIVVAEVLEMKKSVIGTLECGYIETDHGYQPMVIPKFYCSFDDLEHIKKGFFYIEFRDEIPTSETLYYKKVTIADENLTKGGEDE